jgi:hypothetical protein
MQAALRECFSKKLAKNSELFHRSGVGVTHHLDRTLRQYFLRSIESTNLTLVRYGLRLTHPTGDRIHKSDIGALRLAPNIPYIYIG